MIEAIVNPTLRQNIFKALALDEINNGLLGFKAAKANGKTVSSENPATGHNIAKVIVATEKDYDKAVLAAAEAFAVWRTLPAPQRGDIVRQIGEEFRKYKEPLGQLIALETGKILSEGLGEVQEAIDICDFATGLSRQLYGLSMHSERPGHRMTEQWHPLGVVGVITAFNFPCAVWAWNAALAAVCGNTLVWKPSEKAPLTAIATQKIAQRVLQRHGFDGVMTLVVGHDTALGKRLAQDKKVALVSATGSVAMGRDVGQVVAQRFGKSLLELGGNNAIIVWHDADMKLAIRAITFGACGTAGQRCTSTRRLFVHKKIYDKVCKALIKAYGQIKVGDPLAPETLMGPLIDEKALWTMEQALIVAKKQGGKVIYGGKPLHSTGGWYVQPALVQVAKPLPQMQHEVFAPVLYICPVGSLEEAIAYQNDVPQGLSSAIFTQNLKVAEHFLSVTGSDCGIANVNIGTSGAEIGGAFGGEKETGGGRESGSDAWKAYMRRQTCTINYSDALPLAQGVKFEV